MSISGNYSSLLIFIDKLLFLISIYLKSQVKYCSPLLFNIKFKFNFLYFLNGLLGGTFEPCAQIVMQSIGRLGVEENKRYSESIANELESKLGIPKNRAYIFYHDVIYDDT